MTQKATIQSLEEDKALLEDENKAFLKQLESLKDLLAKSQKEAQQAINEQKAAEKCLETALRDHAEVVKEAAAHAFHASRAEGAELDLLKQHNQILHIALAEAKEKNNHQRAGLEKLAQTIQEKEKRIHELHQYEFTHKKTSEQRQELQSWLEKAAQENFSLKSELDESRQLAEQLAGEVKLLQGRSEDGLLASKQLKDDFEASQETIQKLERELQQAHDQLNTIQNASLNVEEEKGELHEELDALRAQLEQLKSMSTDFRAENVKLVAALSQAEALVKLEQDHSSKLDEQLIQQNTLVENARKEIEIIKQALIRGMREANELEARFKESIQEKVGALNKFHHARQQLDKQELDMSKLREELHQARLEAAHKLEQVVQHYDSQEEAGKAAIENMQKNWQEERQAAELREQYLQASFCEQERRLQGEHQHEIEKLRAEKEMLQGEHQHEVEELRVEMQKLEEKHGQETQDLLEHVSKLKIELEGAAKAHDEKQVLARQYEELKADLANAHAQLEINHSICKELEHELHHLSTRCQEKVREHSEIQELVARLSQEKQHLHHLLNNGRAEMEEKESHIKMAQQHLAKKVKETAHLSEEVEKNKQLIYDFQQQQVQYQIRIAELQASVDIHTQQEKRLQEQLTEAIKTYDTQVKKWEQKYFDMHDKWQATEMRKKELEKLEERYAQMQAMLTNLGSVMASPLNVTSTSKAFTPRYEEAPKPHSIAHQEARQSPAEENPEEGESPQKPYQNLFNMPKAPDKHRPHLFD